MKDQILTPIAAERYIHNNLHGLDHEECWAIFLSLSKSVISAEMLSKGTLKETSIDARTVLRRALLLNANSIILAHNHPSGNQLPSIADINFTLNLKKACNLLDISLDDHIIVSDQSFYSFADEHTYHYGSH